MLRNLSTICETKSYSFKKIERCLQCNYPNKTTNNSQTCFSLYKSPQSCYRNIPSFVNYTKERPTINTIYHNDDKIPPPYFSYLHLPLTIIIIGYFLLFPSFSPPLLLPPSSHLPEIVSFRKSVNLFNSYSYQVTRIREKNPIFDKLIYK